MTCASCVGRVEKELKAQTGVLEASVNLATQMASVTYLEGAVTPAQLAKAVTASGYATSLPQDNDESQHDRKAAVERKFARATILAGILTMPVFVVEMLSNFIPGVRPWVDANLDIQVNWTIQFVLITLVMFGPGIDFYTKGLPSFLRGKPDMNSLVAIGTLAAWIYSTLALFAPGLFPEGTRAVYFEAAGVIVTLILLGRWLEARAKGRTGEAIRKLVGLQPKTALVLRDGQATEVDIDAIAVGETVRVRPGERVALDGIVAEGATYIDESMISGEPVPVEKSQGVAVTGGTVNGTGVFSFTVTKTGADTMLAQIIQMVEDAQGTKLPIQDLVNKITMYFVPAVLILAALTVLVWLAFGPDPALGFALVAGVSVLIVACPCAMGLATPTSIMVGTGRAAEMGVLFRKGDALQALQNAQIVAFDKTGTLTAGRPELTEFTLCDGFDESAVLQAIASVEAMSEHPIAQAIVRAGQARGLAPKPLENFESLTGFGVQAQTDGQTILIGADRLMLREAVATDALDARAAEIAQTGQTPLYVAIDGKLAALIGVSDPIKPATPQAIAALHAMGKQVVMITGDNKATAQVIADRLGIDDVVAEVLPEGKVAALQELRKGGATLAYVGDGINDAPALAVADVGIAIGTGTDVAIESADVVLMSGDIGGVVNAFAISRSTMRNIRQNLFWAFAYNTALIPVAAGGLYVFGGPLLSPMLAAGAMALSSVFVLSNALRLRWVKRSEGLA
jgi:Cu+-exporting ATPase